MTYLKLLFGMDARVPRRPYLLWGVGLMILKYLGEATMYYTARGKFLSPLNFLSPLLTYRYPEFSTLPDWFGPALILWSLPFIWIGVGMTIRRAADAGFSPWLGVVFFIPGLNDLLMIFLTIVPSSKADSWGNQKLKDLKGQSAQYLSPAVILALFAFLGTLFTWFSASFLRTYTTSLFVGGPLLIGLVQGYLLNFRNPIGIKKTIGMAIFTILLIHLFLLLFALEGAICLAMSFPIAAFLGTIGATFGAAIAGRSGASLKPTMLLLVLPIMPVAERAAQTPHPDMVVSRIAIAAPPEKVWPHVVKFSDLPPTHDWLFKLGVAYPVRARIDGHGVGAVRRCEFSTGAFVEPITAWDEPNRLAFDVRFQPPPMKELSFYDRVDAPHLNGYFRSVRGEFKLLPTADGRGTILEGRTWYETDIQPGWYWQIYGRWFIHKIHDRVLEHIKNLTENFPHT